MTNNQGICSDLKPEVDHQSKQPQITVNQNAASDASFIPQQKTDD